MSVTTMEEFTALEEGAHVTTGDRITGLTEWVKTGRDVWTGGNGRFQVHERHFSGAISAGNVTNLNARPAVITPGEAYDDGMWIYVVIEQDQEREGQWYVAQFAPSTSDRSGSARFVQTMSVGMRPDSVRPLVPQPAYAAVARSMGHVLQSVRRDRDAFARRVNELSRAQSDSSAAAEEAIRRERRTVQTALHRWARDNDLADNSSLAELLDSLNLARIEEEVEVEITAWGSSNVAVPEETAASMLPSVEGVQAELNDSVLAAVPWRVELKTTRTVSAGACGCDTLTRGVVRDLLVGKGVQVEDLDGYEASCPNC